MRDAVGILKALAIPGVVIFALCLFFAKLVAYTFLYWLPFYLSQTGMLDDFCFQLIGINWPQSYTLSR